jgi:hypothetical protein
MQHIAKSTRRYATFSGFIALYKIARSKHSVLWNIAWSKKILANIFAKFKRNQKYFRVRIGA